MSNVGFEAGSEWTTAEAAVTQPQPTPEAPAAEEISETSTSADTQDTWDKDPEDNEPVVETPKTKETAPSEFEVKGSKGVKKFKLDPNDPELTRTIQMGMDYRRMQQERDQAKQLAAKQAKEFSSVADKAKIWDELNEMARLGHREKIAQAVLGEEGYAKLREEILLEQAAQESGDPDVRYEYEKAKSKREQTWQETQYQKKMREMEEKLSQIEEKGQLDSYRTLGTSALQKHDFRGFIEDKDTATALNNKLWKIAWSDIEELADSGETVTPELVNKVFAQNAKILRAGQGRVANERVNKLVEQRKADTKQKLQVAATQATTGREVDLSGWNGRAKDLLKLLVKG